MKKTFLLIPQIPLDVSASTSSNDDLVQLKQFLEDIQFITTASTKNVNIYKLSVDVSHGQETLFCISSTLKDAVNTCIKELNWNTGKCTAIIELGIDKKEVANFVRTNAITDLKEQFIRAYLFKDISPNNFKKMNLKNQQELIIYKEVEEASASCFINIFGLFARKNKTNYQQQVDLKLAEHTGNKTNNSEESSNSSYPDSYQDVPVLVPSNSSHSTAEDDKSTVGTVSSENLHDSSDSSDEERYDLGEHTRHAITPSNSYSNS